MGSEAVSVYRTSDAGEHWSRVACTPIPATPANQQCGLSSGIGFGGHKDNLVFASPSTGFLTNNNNAGKPFLYVTHDDGVHWQVEPSALPNTIPAQNPRAGLFSYAEYQRPLFFNRLGILPTTVSACREHGHSRSVCRYGFYALLSHDGGRTWPMSHQFPIPYPWRSTPNRVWQAMSASTWYLVGTARLWVTTDSGLHWRAIPIRLPSGYAPVQVQFVTSSTGWIIVAEVDQSDDVARATRLLETKDGGQSWAPVRLPGSSVR